MTGRGTRRDRKAGFTLVEMLVVIGIIVVLVAILFPVFTTARVKAAQVRCIAKMQSLVVALKEYRRDFHRYPPKPEYQDDRDMYTGGFSALYPNYLDNWDALVCPSDRAIGNLGDQAKARRYSSYNGIIALAEDSTLDPTADASWHFATYTAPEGHSGPKVAYNYYGYDNNGWDSFDASNCTAPENGDSLPTWLSSEGKGWKHFPRLCNRSAPDNTIATHCPSHRSFYHDTKDEKDTMARVSSDADLIVVHQWQVGSPSLFKTQQQ